MLFAIMEDYDGLKYSWRTLSYETVELCTVFIVFFLYYL